MYETPPAPAGFDTTLWAGGQLLRAIVILGAVAAVSTAVGVLLRRPLAASVALLAALLVSLGGAEWSSTRSVSPAYWLGAWMRFRPATQWVDHVWVDSWSADAGQASAVLALCLAAVAALAVASLRIARSDVG